ncbi:MAG: stage II sporulation protein R [Clostridia bacterium]|nr:stage II sporulation protein R [Clostridia bacterium]
MRNNRIKAGIKIAVVSLLICLTVLTTAGAVYSENVFNSISENVVRLHVIANSDSKEDQTLKLKVRDAIVEYTRTSIDCYSSSCEVLKALSENCQEIKAVAEKCLRDEGSSYSANVYVGEYDFPSKNYGNYCFPAGKYQALRVVIGEGDGKNWWCVLFPPLCYISENAVSVSSDAEESLRKNLSEEAFSTIDGEKDDTRPSVDNVGDSSGIDGDVQVTYKFKIVDLFQNIISFFKD